MRDKVLWIGCLGYAALFTWLGAVKFAVHRNLVDFGIFTQTSVDAFGGFHNPIEGSHWAFHFSPILFPIGIALALGRSPLVLIALQAIAGALVAPPIYALVLRARNDVGLARLAALVAWLYPPLAGLIFGDFHENGFVPAAVAWTLYAFDAGLMGWTLGGALLTLTVKEDQAIFLGIAGALGAWRFRGTQPGRIAGAIALIALCVLIYFFAFLQPHAASAASPAWQPERFYAWSAADVRTLSGGIFARIGFLLLVFVPLLFLPFRSAMVVLAIAPLGEVLLSRMPTAYTIGTHYAGAWIGYVLVAFAFGLRTIAPPRARTALILCAALCVVQFAVADPLHPGLNLRRVEPRDAALDAFLITLPAGARVATQEEAYTHLALYDHNARLLPESAAEDESACFILIDRDFPNSARLQEYGDAVTRLVREHRYALVKRSGGIELYRLAAACPG